MLREPRHDYTDGDRQAIEAGVQRLKELFSIGQSFRNKTSSEQLIEIRIYFDFYGQVKMPVWGPAFYLGKALHIIQDSFTHTIRSEDMTKILHVLNYAEALYGKWEQQRDGLRHSTGLDSCSENNEKDKAAGEATKELFEIANSIIFDGLNPDTASSTFIDKWFQYQPGCDYANNYCDSKWAVIAAASPTVPYTQAVFGCNLAAYAQGLPLVYIFLGCWFCALLIRRIL